MGRAIDRNPLQIYARLEHGENRLLLGAIDRPTFEREYVVPFNRARAETLFQDAEARLLEPDHADEVERNLQAVINTTPNHYGAYLVLAELYYREGNPEEEKAVLERMLSQFGSRPEVVSKIEEYLRATGRREAGPRPPRDPTMSARPDHRVPIPPKRSDSRAAGRGSRVSRRTKHSSEVAAR